MGVQMKDKFNKYYESFKKVNMVVLIAVTLDFRKKLNYVRYCYKLIYDNAAEVDKMFANVKFALKRVFKFSEKSCHTSRDKIWMANW